MKKRYRKFLLHAPLARVARSLGLDMAEDRVFQIEALEQTEALYGRMNRPGPKPKGINWDKVNAIKARGADNYANDLLAQYKARLDDLRTDLHEQGVTLEGMDAGERRHIAREVAESWGVAGKAAPTRSAT
jgi:hypothetical protein